MTGAAAPGRKTAEASSGAPAAPTEAAKAPTAALMTTPGTDPCDLVLPPTSERVLVSRYSNEGRPTVDTPTSDLVAQEVPVALQYNGVSHAVMMASPADLEDFVVGFSLTEGIIGRANEIYDIETLVLPAGVQMTIDIGSEAFAGLKDRRRSLTGRTGCGICGAENLDHALRQPPPVSTSFTLSSAAAHHAFVELRSRQPLQQATGATHAAGWIDPTGRLTLVREDVGRHNALDKLLGALARAGTDTTRGAVIVTSRASVEMVQKAAMLGVPILATISGPTGLAIAMAQQTGLTLAAFFREHGHVRYTHGHRLI